MSKILTIRWQRLVDGRGKTCPRCGLTGGGVESAARSLRRRLKGKGIDVRIVAKEIRMAAFKRSPSRSNRIWIGGKPLEKWLEAKAGRSRCCGACGPSPCRTLEVGKKSYAAVPADLIILAGLKAAGALKPAPVRPSAASGSRPDPSGRTLKRSSR